MRRRPLACCALALAAGILTAPGGVSPSSWFALVVTLLAGAPILILVSPRRDPIRQAGFLVLLGFGCIGGLARDVAARKDATDVAEIVSRHPSLVAEGVEVRGQVAGIPRRCPERLVESPCIDLTIELSGITALRIDLPVTGRVRLRIAGLSGTPTMPVPLVRGDRIRAHARLFTPSIYRNPGSFDSIRHLNSRGIAALGRVKSPRLVHAVARDDAGGPIRLMRWVDGLGERLSDRIDLEMPDSEPGRRGSAVGRAILLGDTTHIDPDDMEQLRRAGVSHLLAVSGFHVGVLACSLLLLARTARLRRRWRFVAIVPALFLYLLINHAHTSLDRAVTMAALAFVGRAFWRPPDPFNALGLALLIILGNEPRLIHDAGFQLTFIATASLLIAFVATKNRTAHRTHLATAWAGRAVRTTVAILIGTLPIAVMHFNRVSPGAVLGNLMIAPLMATVLILLIGLEVVALLPGGLHLWVVSVIVCLIEWSFGLANILGSIPLLSYRRITPSGFTVVLYYASITGLFAGRRMRSLGILAGAGLAAALLILLLPIDTRRPPEGLRLTVLDVGQGDAALVETPGGDRLLIDAGGRTPNGFDLGDRVVSRALWSMGISSIGILVVTHPDADHAGGAAAIVRNFRPRIVMVSAGSASWLDRSILRSLRDAIAESGIGLTEVSEGDSACLRGAHLRVLHPPGTFAGMAGNESSIVLKLSASGRDILLPGDAGVMTERTLLAGAIQSDILKVGHHGSRTSSSSRFLDRVDPKVAIISCGRRNRFGHPHAEVLARLEARARRVLRTDEDGAVDILLTPGATLLRRAR